MSPSGGITRLQASGPEIGAEGPNDSESRETCGPDLC